MTPPELPGPDDLPRLREGLRRLDTPGPRAVTRLDEAVGRAAGTHFAPRSRRRRAAGWSAAAAIGLVVTVWGVWALGPGRGTSELLALDPRDVDASGRVDMLDAFALARAIEDDDGPATGAHRVDVTGDGRVDDADVRAIARAAVALDREVGS